MPSAKQLVPRWLKRRAKRAVRSYRQATWRGRMDPRVIIIGTQKGGTTSLFHYLQQHPQLVGSYTKEVHYFDGGLDPSVDTFAVGLPWYRSHFPRSDENEGLLAFEASPLYLYNPLCAERIAAALPDTKLIALLRNPTERAISNYFHETLRGRETLPIEQALDAEESRLAEAQAAGDYKHHNFVHHSYQARGRYLEQLERFEALFPAEQRFVAASEELFSDPATVVRRVLEFIGVDADFEFPDLRPQHVSGNRTKVEPGVYERLDAYFAPHNRALYEHLGQDFGW